MHSITRDMLMPLLFGAAVLPAACQQTPTASSTNETILTADVSTPYGNYYPYQRPQNSGTLWHGNATPTGGVSRDYRPWRGQIGPDHLNAMRAGD